MVDLQKRFAAFNFGYERSRSICRGGRYGRFYCNRCSTLLTVARSLYHVPAELANLLEAVHRVDVFHGWAAGNAWITGKQTGNNDRGTFDLDLSGYSLETRYNYARVSERYHPATRLIASGGN